MTRRVQSLGLGVVLAASVACGDPEIVVPGVLSVEFYPPNGSIGISTNVEGLIAFTHEVADVDAAAAAIELTCLGFPNGTSGCLEPAGGCTGTTSATVEFAPSGMEARVAPDPPLDNGTCYAYRVAGGIEAAAKNVGPLPSDRRSAFQTF